MARDDRPAPEIERHLPLKPVVFHILLALAEGPAHGYGVIQSVRQRSEGRIPLPTGAFYRHLRRLLDDAWVREIPAPARDDDARRGSYYQLTPLGRKVMRAEWRRMADLVAVVRTLGVATGPERR